MPVNEPVSLTRQTIFCFIPFLDMYAAYKIKKLRWYLLIAIGLSLAMVAVELMVNPISESDDPALYMDDFGNVDWGKIWFGPNPEVSISFMIVHIAIALIVAVYLIRRWSKKWNEKFSGMSSQDSI